MTPGPQDPSGRDSDASIDDGRFELLLMAQQHYEEGLSYGEIGRLHHKSPATISRRLTDAQEKGLIVKRTEIKVPPEFRERLIEAMQFTRIARRLEAALNRRGAEIRRVIVALGDVDPARETMDTDENGRPRARRVARQASRLLAGHLRELTKERDRIIQCGINWGYSVRDVCTMFPQFCDGALEQTENISFSGISGPFWVKTDQPEFWRQASSSTAQANARLLASAFTNSDSIIVHHLHVPVYLKAEMENLANSKETLAGFVRMDPGYLKLYGSKPMYPDKKDVETFVKKRNAATEKEMEGYGSITEHDLILSGFSALTRRASLVRFADEHIFDNTDRLKNEEGICGDLASHLFSEDGSIPRDDSAAGQINRRALTLWPEDLQDVAERTRKSKSEYGGVILFSNGRDRAKVLCTILTKMRAANDIVIDSNLAYALYPLVGLQDHREGDFERK